MCGMRVELPTLLPIYVRAHRLQLPQGRFRRSLATGQLWSISTLSLISLPVRGAGEGGHSSAER